MKSGRSNNKTKQRKARAGTSLLVCALLLISGAVAHGQIYTKWFIAPERVPCENITVGYADPSYIPDSAAARAVLNGYEAFARQTYTHISGGQAFWSTEGGVYWMGANFQERFDSSYVQMAQKLLTPVDTLFTKGLVAVLLSTSDCSLDSTFRSRISIRGESPPPWIESVPQDDAYLYATGVAPLYFHEISSWIEAEQLARRNLARAVYTEIKSLQKMSSAGQEIRHEALTVSLHQVRVVRRWLDFKNKICYVLVKTHKGG